MQKGNIKKSCHPGRLLSGGFRWNNLSPLLNEDKQPYLIIPSEDAAQRPCGMTTNLMGFTLIELLVVVLIIGILAAVAGPQYQKAIEKTKAKQAISLLYAVARALEVYRMANGAYPYSFRDVDVEIPWTGNEGWYIPQHMSMETRSTPDWSLQWFFNESNGENMLMLGRLSGSYRGGGFIYYLQTPVAGVKTNALYCAERKSTGVSLSGTPGRYCHNIFNAADAPEAETVRRYLMP